MAFARCWRVISAGLILAVGAPDRAMAQGPPVVPETVFIPGHQSITGILPNPTQPDHPLPGVPSGGCTCQYKPGWMRGIWHRTHCKRHLQQKFLGYPEEFNEWPLGASLYAQGRSQVANGTAAQMIFYRYDFVDGTDALNVRGQDKLARIAAQLPTSFFPVVVERTPDEPGLDQTRRTAILNGLASYPFPIPAERVVIGPPIANGLNGREALILNTTLQAQTYSRGSTATLGATVGGSGLDATGLSAGVVGGGGGGSPIAPR
jgi:hypothetical protein